jgi:hypothetical protein
MICQAKFGLFPNLSFGLLPLGQSSFGQSSVQLKCRNLNSLSQLYLMVLLMASDGYTVVENPTHNPEIEGLNPASDTGGLHQKTLRDCNKI